ncbi:helix-turn-helix domain-containing protein [Pseudomonas anguilliseptica]|uniref:Peptidase S24-like n=1 Tax=Pseudomonas anguilliseptica TaxID=53406 RepID=A0A1H5F4P7_PSEAG|nr:LexA family transcriptional regulator [Pseudomonas anguilliseptica]SED98253.1 Peptidase S24-like [Pseudomonas anguilliseptica]
MHNSIDKVLKHLMKLKGANQVSLSAATRVTQSTISRILKPNGPKGIKSPSDTQVKPLADFFGISTDQLRGREPLPEDLQPLSAQPSVKQSMRPPHPQFEELRPINLSRSSAFLTSKSSSSASSAIPPDLRDARQNVTQAVQPYRKDKEYPLISWVAAGCWEESCDNFNPGDADEWLRSDVNAGPHGYWLEVRGPSMLPTFAPGMRILVKPENFDLVSGKYYVAKLLDTGETTFKQYLRDSGSGYLHPLNQVFAVIPITENVSIIGMVVDAKLPASIF